MTTASFSHSPTDEEIFWHNITEYALRATESAAFAAAQWIGRGDNMSADAAAVSAMRDVLNTMPVNGTVVIGEGERDKAPLLYTGEKFGSQDSKNSIDIAVDPLEGTTLTAQNKPDAITVIAITPSGNLLKSPDIYMKKFATSIAIPENLISLNQDVLHNIQALAKFTNRELSDLTVSCLDRERHQNDIQSLREEKVKVMLLQDGDIKACIQACTPNSGVDAYIGSGGAPEGVISACAIQCLGGIFLGKLQPRNELELNKLKKQGIDNPDTIYSHNQLANNSNHITVIATGVTRSSYSGMLNLKGVNISKENNTCSFNSVVFTHSPSFPSFWQKIDRTYKINEFDPATGIK